jgi:hypothetical protein
MSSRSWRLEGTVFVACNCDYGCPCNFNALPTQGKCEGGWTWHVDDGGFDGVSLAGLGFSIYVNWPGPIHEGGGEAVALVDERADAAERGAIAMLTGGDHGGPWGVLAWTWPTVHGPHFVHYELSLDGVNWHVRAGDQVEIESEPIRNPVTGAEVRPGAVLPEGIIFKHGDFGSSKTFRISGGIALDHPGQYTAVGPFEYAGP